MTKLPPQTHQLGSCNLQALAMPIFNNYLYIQAATHMPSCQTPKLPFSCWQLSIQITSSSERTMFRSGLSKGAPISRGFLCAQIFNKGYSAQTGRKLEGKVALITGAASGIGKATATIFINNGAKVIIADIQHQLGQETADQLGPSATFIPCDVTKESDVSDAVDFAVSKYNKLDIMYNNAGVPCKTARSIVDLDLKAFDRVMNINVRGMMAGIKHASRVMIPRREGSIICSASITGIIGGMAQHSYSVTKSAVIGIVKSLAAELCKHGIRINSISPFAIATPFSINELKEMYPGVETDQLVDFVERIGVLEGAKCEPVDVANAALYLGSDDARYVSGHNLVVDGGLTAFRSLELPQL